MDNEEKLTGVETASVSYEYNVPFDSLHILARRMLHNEEAYRKYVMQGYATASPLERSGRVDYSRMFSDLLYRGGMFGPEWRHIESSSDIEEAIDDLRGYARNGQLLVMTDEWKTGRVHYMCDGVASYFDLRYYLDSAVFKDGCDTGKPAGWSVLQHYTYLPSEESVKGMLNELANMNGDTPVVEVEDVSYNIDTRMARVVVKSIGMEGVDVVRAIDKALEDTCAAAEDREEASV